MKAIGRSRPPVLDPGVHRMLRALLPLALVAAPVAALGTPQGTLALEKPLVPVPFTQVKLADPFLAPRSSLVRTAVLPACLARCEETGRVRNFAVAAGKAPGEHQGALYDDSDVYRVLEGIAYALATRRDAELERRADEIIELIAAAQLEDGYLNTYYQLVEPTARWKNMAHGHELYCAGHLIEAGVAYASATGKERLLDVATKLAERIAADFGPGKRLDPCGHPEIELALVGLARYTGEARYAELARFFVDQRGSTQGRSSFGEYAQDHAPVREQKEIVGHAVRAMYLYSGMADVAGTFRDETLIRPLAAIWRDLVETKLYVTGGIGSSASNEGITAPYDLPNDAAYCETCASIGMLFWNHRMFLATGRSCFVDLYERELYNAIPAGLALTGDRFFYSNPLASRGGKERVPWFDTACCPTNLARTLPGVGRYAYATGPDALYVLLFAQGTAEVDVGGTHVRLVTKSEVPWQGLVELTVEPARPATFDLWLRVPDWAEGHSVIAPPLPAGTRPDDPSIFPRNVRAAGSHWRVVRREWKHGDKVVFDLSFEAKRTRSDPKVEANTGRVALRRGPVLYAFEGVDHDGRARNLVLKPEVLQIDAVWKPDLLGGVNVLEMKGERVRDTDPFVTITEPVPLSAVPYATWANRGSGEMVVWIAEEPERAERPGEGARRARPGGKLLRSSHLFEQDTLAALDDGVVGKDSADESVPRCTFRPKQGTQWIEVDFREPKSLTGTAVQWFDDGGRGQCRAPRSWRALWRDGTEWKPVTLAGGTYASAKDTLNAVRFERVRTKALRLEIELAEGHSGGLLEWSVDEGP